MQQVMKQTSQTLQLILVQKIRNTHYSNFLLNLFVISIFEIQFLHQFLLYLSLQRIYHVSADFTASNMK